MVELTMVWRFLAGSKRRGILSLLGIFLLAILLFTISFHALFPLLEGREISWLQALLFILETITTVGYGELLPFRSDYTILFTIVLILAGVFMIFLSIPVLLEPVLTRIISAPPPTETRREMKGHVVIAGYGNLARALIESLIISDLGIVIVEPDEAVAREVVARYRSRVSVVWGDYMSPRTWEHAWVRHAHSVVLCEDERTAAEIILGVRDQTRGSIIAAVDDLAYDRYLRYAGAEYVLSPKNSTGKILARHAAMRPDVDTIFEAISLDHMKLEEGRAGDGTLKLVKVPVMPGCIAFGKSLGESPPLRTLRRGPPLPLEGRRVRLLAEKGGHSWMPPPCSSSWERPPRSPRSLTGSSASARWGSLRQSSQGTGTWARQPSMSSPGQASGAPSSTGRATASARWWGMPRMRRS